MPEQAESPVALKSEQPSSASAGGAPVADAPPDGAAASAQSAPQQEQAADTVQARVRSAGRGTHATDYWEWSRAGAPFFDTAQIGQIHIYQSGAHLYERSGAQPTQSAGLTVDEFKLINAVYVSPPAYDDAYTQLDQNRWVVLQGHPGVGKRATAIRLAIQFLGSFQEADKGVRELPPETDLRRWQTEATVEPDTFYFVDGWIADRAAEMSEYNWRALGQQLARCGSYLVLCCSAGVKLPSDMPQGAVLVWRAPGDARRLLQNHLRFYDVPDARCAELLHDDAVRRLLDQQLGPGRLKVLAWRLNRYHQGEYATLAAALAGFTAHEDATVAARLKQAADDRERSFQIALAVFSGARYRAVEEAAERLAELLAASRPRPPQGDQAPGAQPAAAAETSLFDEMFDDKLARAQAVVETVAPPDHDGPPIEIVRYGDASFQPALLSFVWRRSVALRKPLLAWLREQGYSPYRDMRMRVAWTAAFLAQLEYETVLAELLRPWAQDGDADDRRFGRMTLSYALRALVQNQAFTQPVLNLLRTWSSSSNLLLAQAAVRAYILVGEFFPREALTQWHRILRSWPFEQHFLLTERLGFRIRNDQVRPLFDSLIDAVLTFFFNALLFPRRDFERIYREILAMLREWLAEDQNNQFFSSIVMIMWVGLMHVSLEEEESGASAERPTLPSQAPQPDAGATQPSGPPALLVLVQNLPPSDPCLQDLAHLLSFAIRDKRTRNAALDEALYRWVDYVETDRHLTPALEAVLQALASEPQFNQAFWRREVGRRLENWSTQRPRPGRRPLPVAGQLVRTAGLQRA